MFISWAVTSNQSNGAGCDFSQGISVCLIEIPYPIRRVRAPSTVTAAPFPLSPRTTPRDSHASHSFLSPSFFVLSTAVFFTRRFIPSLRSVPRGSISDFIFPPLSSHSPQKHPSPRILRKGYNYLSASTLIDIAFCPSCCLLLFSSELTEDTDVHAGINLLVNASVLALI